MSDDIKHECGLAFIRLRKPFSYYLQKHGSVTYGLNKLYLLMEKQHNRGQDGAGIAAVKLNIEPGNPYLHRMRSSAPQPIADLFYTIGQEIQELEKHQPEIKSHPGLMKGHLPFLGELLLGHLRYGTQGKNNVEFCHPFIKRNISPGKNLALAGNFNLVNTDDLFAQINFEPGPFQKQSDLAAMMEVVHHFLAKEDDKQPNEANLVSVLKQATPMFDGGYTIGGLLGNGSSFVMRDAQNLAASYGVIPTYDEKFGEVTFSYQKVYNGTTAAGLATSCTAQRTAWYQDARAFALRAALVDKYRLGGIAQWTLGMEEPLALEGIRNVAKAIAPDQVTATLAIDKSAIKYGEVISISGNFSIKDKSPLAGVNIRIEGKSADSSWRLLAVATTDMAGKFTKPLLIGKATAIRAYTEGTWERSEGISNEVPVLVNRLVLINPPASVKKSESFTVTGSLRPRTAGTFIQVEKLVAGKWQPFGNILTTDAQGGFEIPVAGQPKGTLTLRVSAAGEATWPIATTASFTILIRGIGSSELVK